MSQIMLDLDDATQALLEQAAAANGVSKSRWVVEMIRKHVVHEWDRECLALAGRFPDFPLSEENSLANLTTDLPRIGF